MLWKRIISRHESLSECESLNGRSTYAIIPRISLNRLQQDFFVNQVLTGHGAMGAHQARLFGKPSIVAAMKTKLSYT